jgi:hypothetical protein
MWRTSSAPWPVPWPKGGSRLLNPGFTLFGVSVFSLLLASWPLVLLVFACHTAIIYVALTKERSA